MKKIFNYMAVFAAAISLISCVDEQIGNPDSGDTNIGDTDITDKVTLVDFSAANESTKTTLDSDLTTVLWKTGDEISILSGEDNLLYTAKSGEASTDFDTATEGVKTDAGTVWAVYPYSEENALAEGNVVVAIPSLHMVSAEGFAQDANVTVAYCSELQAQTTLYFKNVCSYMKVTLAAEQGVKSITLSSDSGVALAGTATVKMDESGNPEIVSVSDPVTSVSLSSETALDGTFLMPVLPGEAAVWTLAFVKMDGTESTVAVGKEAAAFVRNIPLAYDFTGASINWKVAPSEVVADKVFWSDAHVSWTHAGKVDAYKVYAEDQLVATVENGVKTAHLTGLANGTSYNIKVAAVYGAEEKVSEEIEITTGAITQLTKNVSPTSVAVNIENMAGALSGNFRPCLYVQLFESEDASANPKYEMFVRDNEVQSEGHPFYKSLVAGSGTTYPPFNLAFGGLEAGKDYWFRVKSVASEKYKTYRGSSILGQDREMTSANGDSEYSQLFKLSTASAHAAAEGEVYYEGFDDFCFGPDFINCAVGQMPAFKTYAQSNTAAVTLNKNVWASWDAADKPWCFHGLRTGYSNNQMAGSGLITVQSDGDTDITFEDASARAVKYWVLVPEGSKKVLAAPKALAGARIGTFKAPSTSGFATLLNNTCFMTEDSYVGSGHAILGNYYTTSDAVNSSSKRAGYAAQINSSLLSTSTAKSCVVTFKALAVQGGSGELTVVHLDRTANHRNATTDLWQTVATIAVANSNGNTDEAATTWSASSDTHKWYEYTCEVNLKKGDLICFATDGNSCICLDEVKITLK